MSLVDKIKKVISKCGNKHNVEVIAAMNKDFRVLGYGAFSIVIRDPSSDEHVIKISRSANDNYMLFVPYCQAHPENPHLPSIQELGAFSANGWEYTVFRLELLENFSFAYNGENDVPKTIIRTMMEFGSNVNSARSFLEPDSEIGSLEASISEYRNEFKKKMNELGAGLLADTILEISSAVCSEGEVPEDDYELSFAMLDLKPANIMTRNGVFVITDPIA